MIFLRGIAFGVLFSTLMLSAVFAVSNPDMTHMRLLITYWPNYLLAALAMLVLGFTETRGRL